MIGDMYMIEKIINGMIEKQVETKQISKDDINIYSYGYTLVYEVLINVIISIIIGILSHKFIEIILFLGLYIPLRSFCGGWHADKFWKCTVYSSLILVIMVMIDNWWIMYCQHWIMFGIFCVCFIFIFFSAPIDTETKPISYEEKKIYKKKINIILACDIVLFMIMLLLNYKMITFIFEYVYVIQSCMLIIEMINKKIKY